MALETKTMISKKQKTLDTLFLQLDIKSRCIRMTRKQREQAKEIMKKIQNGHNLSS